MPRGLLYVDPSIAANSGTGTIGDPFGDIQYALDRQGLDYTRGTDGDIFNIKTGTAEVLTAPLSTTTWGTPSILIPLIFRGYTSAADDGGIGEIDGNGSHGMITTNRNGVFFINMKIGNSGASTVFDAGTDCGIFRCEIHGSSASIMLLLDGNDCQLIDSYVHSYTGSNVAVDFGTGGFIYNSFVNAGSTASVGVRLKERSRAIKNIVKISSSSAGQGIATSAVASGGLSISIIGNSVFNAQAGTSRGIILNNVNGAACVVVNNIVEGWSGVNGRPIGLAGSSGGPVLVGNNLFFNNATNSPSETGKPTVHKLPDFIASASPFINPSSNDFRVTTEAKELGFVQVFRGAALSTNKEDVGACQRIESAGGGGGGTRGYGFS